jgi:hypothetical protein
MKKDSKNNTGTDNSGNRNSGNRNSGDRNSGNRNSGNRNSGDWNSGDGNSGNWNSGDRNSGDRNSGDRNSGDRNSGDRNSGDWNSGYGNSTNRETGIFNTTQGNVRCFNQSTDLSWDEIDHPDFTEFYLNKWIEEEKMTDEEKIASPEFHTRGGYLKTYTWQEAWANYWKDTTEEDRQKVLSLPNFDSAIFKEITGIHVATNQKDESKKQEILKKIEELKKEAESL